MRKLGVLLLVGSLVLLTSGCFPIFHVDRRPAPHRHDVDRRPAPPPPHRHEVDRRPAPAPSYTIQVRPAAPAPRR